MKTEKDIYRKMYCHLFNRITDALQCGDENKVVCILKQAQIDTEEMFMSFEDSETGYDEITEMKNCEQWFR